MKTRYNLSKIMREANRMMKYEGYTRSQALTLAWSKAKRSEFYLIVEEIKPSVNYVTPTQEELYQAAYNFNTNYYANNRYTMD